MFRVEVKSAVTVTREGVSQKGRPYTLVEQRGWFHGVKEYPVEVSWVLEKGQLPFAPGFYIAGIECVAFDRFGAVTLDFRHMKPEGKARAA